jgi:hypothetical protein
MFGKTGLALKTFFVMRGARIVECPETHEPAGVELDAWYAAATAALGRIDLRLRGCSRWPERSGCAQTCMRQIEAAPERCSIKAILTTWFDGKACAICGESLRKVDWRHHKPVLQRPDGSIAEWSEFRPEQIPSALQTHLPVCWECYADESFRRDHPELFDNRKVN